MCTLMAYYNENLTIIISILSCSAGKCSKPLGQHVPRVLLKSHFPIRKCQWLLWKPGYCDIGSVVHLLTSRRPQKKPAHSTQYYAHYKI